jgi:hypothetical protein
MKPRAKNAKTQKQAEQTAAQPQSPVPTAAEIRKRAQKIFEARGCVPGSALEDWLQAEIELKSGIGLRGGHTTN